MHTFSGDAHNLSIDDKAMGCFCEKLPSGGSVKHPEVVYADPGKKLVLSGALGPLQSVAATGSMTIQFAKAGEGTKLAVVYTVTGLHAHRHERVGRARGFRADRAIHATEKPA